MEDSPSDEPALQLAPSGSSIDDDRDATNAIVHGLRERNETLREQRDRLLDENRVFNDRILSLEKQLRDATPPCIVLPVNRRLEKERGEAVARVKELEDEVERLTNEMTRNYYDAAEENRKHTEKISALCAYYGAIVNALTGNGKK